VVEETIKRIGGIEVKVNPVIGMEDPWRYRNKVEWHTGTASGEPVLGYYINDSHKLIDIEDCLLINEEMKDCSRYLKNHLQELQLPAACEIIVRQSTSGDLMFIFNGNGTSGIDISKLIMAYEGASIYSIDQGIARLHNGQPRLGEMLGDVNFEISPRAFFQVNHIQTEIMLEIIKDYAQLRRSDIVLDAYCGTGSIALSIASDVNTIVGVESFKAAVKDAKRNAFNNQITNCRFIKGNCEDIIPVMEEDFNVVILDPPRSGCKAELIQAVINKSPRSIIYVSCNPSTMARDLALFKNTAYTIEHVQPIDMFPQTYHVEVIIMMTLCGQKAK
jgi:23S rRNA (uracil1939-C5)-methyltransferase